jgi:hypothetical protein
MMIMTSLELLQQMGTNHKVKTYSKENIVGLFQTSSSIAINQVQALSSRQETKKVWNKH